MNCIYLNSPTSTVSLKVEGKKKGTMSKENQHPCILKKRFFYLATKEGLIKKEREKKIMYIQGEMPKNVAGFWSRSLAFRWARPFRHSAW